MAIRSRRKIRPAGQSGQRKISIPELLPTAFANLALIPEDAAAGNALELPWVLRPESRAGRAITELAAMLVPDLAAKDSSHAA